MARPAPSAAASRRINIRVTVAGTSHPGSWVITIETSRFPSFPVHLLVLRLPSRIRNPENCLRHLGGDSYALTIQLEGAASPAQFTSLAAKTTTELAPALHELFAKWPANLAIHIAEGRVSIAIHDHN